MTPWKAASSSIGGGVGEELAVVRDRDRRADPLAELLRLPAREHGDVHARLACQLVLCPLEREHARQARRHVGAREVARDPLPEVEEVRVDPEVELPGCGRGCGHGRRLGPASRGCRRAHGSWPRVPPRQPGSAPRWRRPARWRGTRSRRRSCAYEPTSARRPELRRCRRTTTTPRSRSAARGWRRRASAAAPRARRTAPARAAP